MKHLKKFTEDLESRDINKHTGYDEDGHSLNYQGNILPLKSNDEVVEDTNLPADSKLQPKVKHLLEYLSKLDPEMDVYLDHDGWDYGFAPSTTELELVENRGLFEVSRDNKYLIINN